MSVSGVPSTWSQAATPVVAQPDDRFNLCHMCEGQGRYAADNPAWGYDSCTHCADRGECDCDRCCLEWLFYEHALDIARDYWVRSLGARLDGIMAGLHALMDERAELERAEEAVGSPGRTFLWFAVRDAISGMEAVSYTLRDSLDLAEMAALGRHLDPSNTDPWV